MSEPHIEIKLVVDVAQMFQCGLLNKAEALYLLKNTDADDLHLYLKPEETP